MARAWWAESGQCLQGAHRHDVSVGEDGGRARYEEEGRRQQNRGDPGVGREKASALWLHAALPISPAALRVGGVCVCVCVCGWV